MTGPYKVPAGPDGAAGSSTDSGAGDVSIVDGHVGMGGAQDGPGAATGGTSGAWDAPRVPDVPIAGGGGQPGTGGLVATGGQLGQGGVPGSGGNGTGGIVGAGGVAGGSGGAGTGGLAAVGGAPGTGGIGTGGKSTGTGGKPGTGGAVGTGGAGIVAQVEQSFCIDTNRIFAVGWSYGASMAYHLACSRPQGGAADWFVRGVAVYSGAQMSGTCTPSKSVAYYASHGVSDSVLAYNSGLGLFQKIAGVNGCTYVTPAAAVSGGSHVCTALTGCEPGYPSEFCSFYGDHTPDPKDPNQSTSWEYQKTWDFLRQL